MLFVLLALCILFGYTTNLLKNTNNIYNAKAIILQSVVNVFFFFFWKKKKKNFISLTLQFTNKKLQKEMKWNNKLKFRKLFLISST